jgi:3-oxoacyl-[acyl-carrier protein] reductase
MDLSLKGKQALVCGSTQGIGKAIAIELALLGADVTLFARNELKLAQTIGALDTSQGQFHDYLVADFTKTDRVREVVQKYGAKKTNLHILVNNTGGPPPGDAIEARPEDFVRAFEQHLVANQMIVQAVVPVMKQNGYGRIINVISTSVKTPIPGLGVSNTVRGAVASWAKTLSRELAPHGITVNNILPGLTKTGRLEGLIENRAKNLEMDQDELAEMMKEDIPARRFAEPHEVAALAAFLASPAAAYINGTSIPVDGGNTPSI